MLSRCSKLVDMNWCSISFASRTFSRHGKMKASFLLLIWLNEKVQKITFAENLRTESIFNGKINEKD